MFFDKAKVGEVYRLYDFGYSVSGTFTGQGSLNSYFVGIQSSDKDGNADKFSFKLDKPGIIYAGAFRLGKSGLALDFERTERQVFEDLVGQLDGYPTWKKLALDHLKELKK